MWALTPNRTHVVCWSKRVHDAEILPSSHWSYTVHKQVMGGQRHHSPFYKTLYHQHDYETVFKVKKVTKYCFNVLFSRLIDCGSICQQKITDFYWSIHINSSFFRLPMPLLSPQHSSTSLTAGLDWTTWLIREKTFFSFYHNNKGKKGKVLQAKLLL